MSAMMVKSILQDKVSEMKTISVVGRRWFNRQVGNTYHTAEIFVDGKPLAKTGRYYGYSNQYEYTAFEYLKASGFIKDWDRSTQSPYSYCEERGIIYQSTAIDVPNKKDL